MKRAKLLRLLLIVILLVVTFWNVGSTLVVQKDKYFSRTYWQNFSTLKTIYRSSQYVNKHPTGWIPDETVNSYAGGEYMHGTLPQLVAPDTPPLGRYLIGLSAVIFNNENISVILAFGMSLLLMFFVGMQIFSDPVQALIPVAGISTEPILLNQLVYTPLLDVFQLTFLLAFFFFFNKISSPKKQIIWFIATALSLGCFIATKFFITGMVMVAAGIVVLLYRKQIKTALLFLLSTSISIVVLLLTYARSLFFGYSFKSFLGIQKWIFLYHKSQLILPFSIWPLLMMNKWHVWFGNKPVISDPQWRITWPLITILTLVGTVLYMLKKVEKNQPVEVLMVWGIGYLLFFSFGQISARYFVILLPIFYITATFTLVEVVKLKIGQEKKLKKSKK